MRHHVPKWYHDNLYPLQGPHDSRANPETEVNPPGVGGGRGGVNLEGREGREVQEGCAKVHA